MPNLDYEMLLMSSILPVLWFVVAMTILIVEERKPDGHAVDKLLLYIFCTIVILIAVLLISAIFSTGY